MAVDQGVTGPLAVGVGFRKAVSAAAIVSLVEEVLAGFDRTHARLFTLERKTRADNLREAAAILKLPLVGLEAGVLVEQVDGVTIRSARVERETGTPSVAEAAALAGAGRGSRLLVLRRSMGGVTCAVAVAGRASP